MKLRTAAHWSVALGMAALLALPGCATTYYTRPGPRLSITMRDGALGYERNGQFHRAGMFGAGLEEAVAGNPEAEHHAHAYRDGSVAGFALTMTGLGVFLAGTVVSFGLGSAAGFSGSGSGLPTELVGELLSAVVGIGIELAGTFVTLTAAPRLYDAINAFNDGLGPYAFEVMRPVTPITPTLQLPPVPVGASPPPPPASAPAP